MILTWVLLISLFRPWAETSWGYRPMLEDMARHLPVGACVDSEVDPAMAAMLRYHLGKAYQPGNSGCAYRLVATERNKAGTAETSGHGDVIWKGFRTRHKNQVYLLVRRHET
jgi:hypothetical protein